jgi:hypothetical protein
MGATLSALSASNPSFVPPPDSLDTENSNAKCFVDVFWDMNSAPCDGVAPHVVLAGLRGVAAAFGEIRQCFVFAHASSIPDNLKDDMKAVAAGAQVRLVPTGQVCDVFATLRRFRFLAVVPHRCDMAVSAP